MKSAFVSRPFAYPPEVPRELAAICHRAMAPDPAARYAGAGEMRRAIVEHLELTRLRGLERNLDADAQARPRRLLVAVVASLGAAMLCVSSLLPADAVQLLALSLLLVALGAALWRRRPAGGRPLVK